MIISHRKKFVVLAPWKTASTTTRARLGLYCESPYSVFYDFNSYLNRVVHQHMTYADFAALPESRLGYFSAAFVRNPYDRVYSAFRQVQKDIQSQPKAPFPQPWIRTLVMKQLAENFAAVCAAGYDFDGWFRLIDDHQVLEAGRNTSLPLHPAHYWTHMNGKQAVDFVGKVERFEDDFQTLCDRLGIESVSAVNQNVDVDPTEAQRDKRGYKSISLMSPASIARINELFLADFEFFGYERVSSGLALAG